MNAREVSNGAIPSCIHRCTYLGIPDVLICYVRRTTVSHVSLTQNVHFFSIEAGELCAFDSKVNPTLSAGNSDLSTACFYSRISRANPRSSKTFPKPSRADHVSTAAIGISANCRLLAVSLGTDGDAMGEPLILSMLDYSRLSDVLRRKAGASSAANRASLAEKLRRGTLVEPPQIPPYVVTMNSRILLVSTLWGGPRECGLFYPEDANCLEDGISIMSTIGVHLLGCREGATMQFAHGGNLLSLHVLGLTYQPEAARHWHR